MHPDILRAVQSALDEDIGGGDVTSRVCVPDDRMAQGRFLARETLILAGTQLLHLIYKLRGGIEDLKVFKHDGEQAHDGDTIAKVHGSARTLLECERVALNFLQRLSGVATLARQFAHAVEGTKAKVLDTRKTTPGLRVLEKLAAKSGGVTNHRMGLFDA